MDRVTKIGNDTISYDVIGNISSYKGVNYSYMGRKLTSVTSDNLSIGFVYNDINQRIKKINNLTGEVTYYVYENDLLKFEYTGNNWISYLYLDGKVIGFIKNGGSPYYYIYDGIGNIVSIMNSNNERVVNYEYDAFGNVLSITGPENSSLGVPNHFRYKGYYYDAETNLYFLNTRYYSPELCRFISPDSVDYLDSDSINGLNLYAYCGNDPVNMVDPSGHFAISTLLIGRAIGFGIGFVISGGFEVVKQIGSKGWNPTDWDVEQIFLSALGGGVAGAISSISLGSGFVGYLSAFFLGGLGSVFGGMISGSVTDLKTGLIAFGIGSVASVIAYGVGDVLANFKASRIFNQGNKAKSLAVQKLKGHPLNMGAKVLKGSQRNLFKQTTKKEIVSLIRNANPLFRYSFYSTLLSCSISGWY